MYDILVNRCMHGIDNYFGILILQPQDCNQYMCEIAREAIRLPTHFHQKTQL